MFRKILLMTVVLMVLFVSVIQAQAQDVSVYVDGSRVAFPDQQPFIDSNNRTLVPIRFVAQELGANVEWLADEGIVIIEKIKEESGEESLIDQIKNIFTLENLIRTAQDFLNRTLISLKIGDSSATVNGTTKHFDTKPVIINGRTMVPLRFISETLDCEVEWDGATRSVYIYTAGYEKKEKTIGTELPPVGQRQPYHAPDRVGPQPIPRDDYTYPYALEWADSIRIANGYISGRIPSNIPGDVWIGMNLLNGPDVMPGINIGQGETFKYEIKTNDGSLSFRLGLRGDSQSLSSLTVMIPTGELRWTNK